MLKIYHKTVKDAAVRSVRTAKAGSWIVALAPTPEERAQLIETYGLEEGLVNDALDIHEVPRLEKKDGNIYFFTRVPLEDLEDASPTIPLLLVIGDSFVVSICAREVAPITRLLNKGDTKRQSSFSTTQKTRLIATILFEIIGSFNEKLTQVQRRVRKHQVQLDHITNKSIMLLVTYETTLNDYLSALQPTHTALQVLLAGKVLALYENDHDYIEDLFLATGQVIESCKSNLKTIMNVRDAYSTIMTNNLNRVLRFFAAITIILTIPTIIGSFFGMNVIIPYSDSPAAFWLIISITFLISLAVYIIFVKKRWI